MWSGGKGRFKRGEWSAGVRLRGGPKTHGTLVTHSELMIDRCVPKLTPLFSHTYILLERMERIIYRISIGVDKGYRRVWRGVVGMDEKHAFQPFQR